MFQLTTDLLFIITGKNAGIVFTLHLGRCIGFSPRRAERIDRPIFMKFIHFICSCLLQNCFKFSVFRCVIGGVMGVKTKRYWFFVEIFGPP